jgi:transcriptional regulator with XRE-family HTH domain
VSRAKVPNPLQRARQARGLSRQALADRAGVTDRTVLNAEHEHHAPHPATQIVLALALEMDRRELWPGR